MTALASQSAREIDVIGIGTSTIDRLYRVESFPSGDGVVVPFEHTEMGGGPTSTALCTVAALGGRAVMIDRLGQSPNPTSLIAEYANYGVATKRILVSEVVGSTTGHASILVRADGARAITYVPGTVAELSAEDLHDSGGEEAIQSASILHMNGRHHGASLAAIKVAQAAGTLVSFDGGASRFRPESMALAEQADLLIVSLDFAIKATGLGCDTDPSGLLYALKKLAVVESRVIGITDGERGSWFLLLNRGVHHQPSLQPTQLVDTTGCGDTFHGAFLWKYCQSAGDTVTSAEFAASIAAMTCEGLGGRSALARLQSNPN